MRIALLANPQHAHAEESMQAAAEAFASYAVETVNADENPQGADLILAFGGDGTVLRAAETGRPLGIPLLGINYGHVGFLTEADPDALGQVIEQIARGEWIHEARMTIDVEVTTPDGSIYHDWALNEAAVDRAEHSRMIVTDIGVDSRDLSSFTADSVVISTATGSTAYNFSGGGPVVWPNVECMVLTPIAAHALFARPLVVGPDSVLEVRVREEDARIWCDGRRIIAAPAGSTIRAVRGSKPVYLARLTNTPFSGRLVTKFQLPVQGWRSGASA